MTENTISAEKVLKKLDGLFRGYKRDGVDVEDAIQEILDACPTLDADLVEEVAYKIYGK